MRCNTNSVLRGDKMDISLPCPATPARAHHRQITLKCHPSHLDSSFENPLLSLPTHTPFLYKVSCIVCKILSVLTAFNVQTKPDINLGGQGMVITNQGMAIQTCFQQAKHMQFCKIGQWVVFIKTRTKVCIKGRD